MKVMNKYFVRNPINILAQIRLIVFEKNKRKKCLDFGSVTPFFGIKVCVFLENDKTDLR